MEQNGKLNKFFNSNRTSEEYIAKYESNLDYFNELAGSDSVDDLECLISIKLLKYAVSLRKEYYYTKCLAVLAEVERDLAHIKEHSDLYEQYHEVLLFNKGICLRYLKKYRESNVLFKELLRINPDSKLYREWFTSNRINIITSKTRPVYYALFAIGALFMVASALGDKSYWITVIGYIGVLGGIFLLVADSVTVELINRRRAAKR